MERWKLGRSAAEGLVSVFISVGRTYRLNTGCVNVKTGNKRGGRVSSVLLITAGVPVQEVCCIARVSVWNQPRFHSGEPAAWGHELGSTAEGRAPPQSLRFC